LKFIVEDQILKVDPDCDFSGLIPGSENYLRAEFIFPKEWNSYVKIAAFFSPLGTEYEPQILKDGRSCVIPAEALVRRKFKLRIYGMGADGTSMRTNKLTVCQNGG
jgi:hypothetical protein